ncbi:NAD-dependent epimerase/dehydratase family protein [Rhodoplanes sp. SY1]|uniref:NAD-dependent epimerase/dehydratase family protein n=1 Tax=Rhodoplanes sp. SY1 TaxID=3166646 RepID=UPI0038B6555A
MIADRDQLDLTQQPDVETFIAERRPEAVFLVAGRVGGIQTNATYPAQFSLRIWRLL